MMHPARFTGGGGAQNSDPRAPNSDPRALNSDPRQFRGSQETLNIGGQRGQSGGGVESSLTPGVNSISLGQTHPRGSEGSEFGRIYSYRDEKTASLQGRNGVYREEVGETPTPATPKTPRDPAGHTLADLKKLAARSTRRGARATRCPTCRAPILAGLNDDMCAFRVHVDWTPLDPTGELLAILAGRRTFTLELQHAGNPKLTTRTPGIIAASSRLAILRRDIVPQHRCGATLPTIDTKLTDLVVDPNQPCPF